MKVLGISGSLRRDSYNTMLLGAAEELLPDGVELELWEGLKAVPPYDQDDDVEPAPAPAAALRAAIAGADAVLVSTPEYNSSIPGQLKNALDWVSRPLATRAVPVSAAPFSSTTSVPSTSRNEPRKVPTMYATSKPIEEWTGSSRQVPVGRLRLVCVVSIALM